MKKREIPPEERRVVSRKKKKAILIIAGICFLLIIFYKIPMHKTLTATLNRYNAGEIDLFGDTVDVTVKVRVQRNFLFRNTHTGEITVDGSVYDCPAPDVRAFRTLSFSPDDLLDHEYTMFGYTRNGGYFPVTCIVSVKDGRIVDLSVRDDSGTYAGQYR